MIHELKCIPEYFQDIIDGKKLLKSVFTTDRIRWATCLLLMNICLT